MSATAPSGAHCGGGPADATQIRKTSTRESQGASMLAECLVTCESLGAKRPRRLAFYRIAAVGAWAGITALAAAASPVDDMRACAKSSGETAIIACTRAIASNAFKERDLASLHAMRGAELSRSRQHDLALADYDLAIKIEPKAASIYTGRANVYRAKGDSDRAIADFGQAIRLDPRYALAYFDRGN